MPVTGFRRLGSLACSAPPVTFSVTTGDQLGAGRHSLIGSVCRNWQRLAESRGKRRRLVTLLTLESWQQKTPRVTDWRHMASTAGNEIRTHDIHVGNVTHVSSSSLQTQDLRTMSTDRCRTR